MRHVRACSRHWTITARGESGCGWARVMRAARKRARGALAHVGPNVGLNVGLSANPDVIAVGQMAKHLVIREQDILAPIPTVLDVVLDQFD